MGKSSKSSRKELQTESGLEEESEMEDQMLSAENGDDYFYGDDHEEESGEDHEEESDEEGGDDEDGGEQFDDQKDAEMEELEKELTDLRQQEQSLLSNLKRNKDEDVLKGQSVKNQKALWDKTLELRFSLQKVFSSSNKLPKEPLKSSFCDSNENVVEAYLDLITLSQETLDSILELQKALLEKNPSITQVTDGNSAQPLKTSESLGSSNGEGDKEWSDICEMHNRIAPFRNKSIDKWQRKTQVTTGAAAMKGILHAFNQNISEQVASYMRDPSRMIKTMQLKRSAVAMFGAVPDVEGNTKDQDANMDGDPELLDDSEFYQQLLKEFFETFDPTSSETAFYALKRMQTKKRKIVDRRASKSRKIRYNIHEKIVNFMAPQPMDLPDTAPKLFDNLFGLKTKQLTSVE